MGQAQEAAFSNKLNSDSSLHQSLGRGTGTQSPLSALCLECRAQLRHSARERVPSCRPAALTTWVHLNWEEEAVRERGIKKQGWKSQVSEANRTAFDLQFRSFFGQVSEASSLISRSLNFLLSEMGTKIITLSWGWNGRLEISAGPACVDKSWVGVFWVTMAAAAAMAAINLVMWEMEWLNSRYGPWRPEEITAKSPFLTTGPEQKNSGAPRENSRVTFSSFLVRNRKVILKFYVTQSYSFRFLDPAIPESLQQLHIYVCVCVFCGRGAVERFSIGSPPKCDCR